MHPQRQKRARLYDHRAAVLRELHELAEGDGDDKLAEQLGRRLAELDAEIEEAERQLEEENKLAVIADANQVFAARAMSIANAIARRAEAAMDRAMI